MKSTVTRMSVAQKSIQDSYRFLDPKFKAFSRLKVGDQQRSFKISVDHQF